MPQIYEYRGVEGLVAAPITEDSTETFTTGTVIELAGVSEIWGLIEGILVLTNKDSKDAKGNPLKD